MKTIEILNKWVFINGNDFIENLQDRDIIMHIPTLSIIEICPVDYIPFEMELNTKYIDFNYNNKSGLPEHFIAIVISENMSECPDSVILEAIEFYKTYIDSVSK